MTILRIIFVGLMAFAPEDDGSGKLSRVTVLLRDARMASDLENRCIEPHLPVLAWDAKCKKAEDCRVVYPHTFWHCDQNATSIDKDDKMWILAEENLTIAFNGATQKLDWDVNYTSGVKKIHQNKSGHGPIKTLHDRWLEPDVPPRQGLVARLQLENGVFQDCHLAEWDDKTANLWFSRFSKIKGQQKDSDHSGAATDVTVATMTAEGKGRSVVVTGTTFGKGRARSMTLKPYPCSDAGTDDCITLIVSNQTPLLADRSSIGYHFSRLYHFSEKAKFKNRWMPFVPDQESTILGVSSLVGDCATATGRFQSLLKDILDGTKPATSTPPPNLGNRPICPMTDY